MTDYLELSATGDAAGQKVGKLPGSVPLHDLRGLGHPESPIKAIRAKCVDCSGGSVAEARRCHLTRRAGRPPHHSRRRCFQIRRNVSPRRMFS
jgi:hypothetical protein